MRDSKEEEFALAVAIFKKEQHLDPDDCADFDLDDFGFSRLDETYQRYYLSLANHLYAWLCEQGWRPPHA